MDVLPNKYLELVYSDNTIPLSELRIDFIRGEISLEEYLTIFESFPHKFHLQHTNGIYGKVSYIYYPSNENEYMYSQTVRHFREEFHKIISNKKFDLSYLHLTKENFPYPNIYKLLTIPRVGVETVKLPWDKLINSYSKDEIMHKISEDSFFYLFVPYKTGILNNYFSIEDFKKYPKMFEGINLSNEVFRFDVNMTDSVLKELTILSPYVSLLRELGKISRNDLLSTEVLSIQGNNFQYLSDIEYGRDSKIFPLTSLKPLKPLFDLSDYYKIIDSRGIILFEETEIPNSLIELFDLKVLKVINYEII